MYVYDVQGPKVAAVRVVGCVDEDPPPERLVPDMLSILCQDLLNPMLVLSIIFDNIAIVG